MTEPAGRHRMDGLEPDNLLAFSHFSAFYEASMPPVRSGVRGPPGISIGRRSARSWCSLSYTLGERSARPRLRALTGWLECIASLRRSWVPRDRMI